MLGWLGRIPYRAQWWRWNVIMGIVSMATAPLCSPSITIVSLCSLTSSIWHKRKGLKSNGPSVALRWWIPDICGTSPLTNESRWVLEISSFSMNHVGNSEAVVLVVPIAAVIAIIARSCSISLLIQSIQSIISELPQKMHQRKLMQSYVKKKDSENDRTFPESSQVPVPESSRMKFSSPSEPDQ